MHSQNSQVLLNSYSATSHTYQANQFLPNNISNSTLSLSMQQRSLPSDQNTFISDYERLEHLEHLDYTDAGKLSHPTQTQPYSVHTNSIPNSIPASIPHSMGNASSADPFFAQHRLPPGLQLSLPPTGLPLSLSQAPQLGLPLSLGALELPPLHTFMPMPMPMPLPMPGSYSMGVGMSFPSLSVNTLEESSQGHPSHVSVSSASTMSGTPQFSPLGQAASQSSALTPTTLMSPAGNGGTPTAIDGYSLAQAGNSTPTAAAKGQMRPGLLHCPICYKV